MNPAIAQGMYYGQIVCDPRNVDRIYVPNVILQVSDDGGRTLRPLGERSKHVGNHAIWIDPKNTDYYLVGCDGGVYESFDRGDSWRAISGDLTRQLDRNKLPVMGKIWGPDAVAKHQSTSFYGNIVALSESPKREGLIYVGTDDGLIQVTKDGGKKQRAVTGAVSSANELKTKLTTARRALMETPSAGDKLFDDVSGIDKGLNEIIKASRGDQALRARQENLPPSIAERVNSIVNEQRMSTSKPTQTQVNAYNIAAQEFEVELKKLRALVEVDVAKLEKSMESVGAPWTPGRVPVWQDR
jgi:hypothetical protein